MKLSEAVEITRKLMLATQRYRSMSAETIGSDPLLAQLQPWSLGENSILKPLVQIMDQYERSGIIAPTDVYNIVTLARMKTPEILALYGMMFGVELPKPNLDWLKGWEAQDA